MKTLLYTGYDLSYGPLAVITVPRMSRYAARKGMDFRCYQEPLIDVPNGIYWTGVCGALKAFEDGYDRAIYLDVDQLITNFDYVLPKWKWEFNVSRDWGEDADTAWKFSMCGFSALPSFADFFRQVLSFEPKFRDKPFPEQLPMQEWLKVAMNPALVKWPVTEDWWSAPRAFNDKFAIHPRKVFNCVPDQVCPGKVPEPWTPDCWCAHITMVPIERRIEIARQILKDLKA